VNREPPFDRALLGEAAKGYGASADPFDRELIFKARSVVLAVYQRDEFLSKGKEPRSTGDAS
jgi:hypothetical protein